jgi:hypothetical protein
VVEVVVGVVEGEEDGLDGEGKGSGVVVDDVDEGGGGGGGGGGGRRDGRAEGVGATRGLVTVEVVELEGSTARRIWRG